MDPLSRVFSAPLRFYRYMDRPGRELRERRAAMPPGERAKVQWREERKMGFFLLFAKLGPPVKPPPRRQDTRDPDIATEKT